MKVSLQTFILFLFLLTSNNSFSQYLKPYFDKEEYRELLYVSIRTTDDEDYYSKFPAPENYELIYKSGEMGLANYWQMWKSKIRPVGVISIRGTVRKPESALSNFYAAMVPAKGELVLSPADTFKYNLCPNPKATVHIGWLISMRYLSLDILPEIDSLYKTGIKDFLIMGHSQGGGIAYLLTTYLYNLQTTNRLPADIRFKTYCSAAPKPGNLQFAYYYEKITENKWSFTIVNAVDWVPEAPISIERLNDFNVSSPFVNAKDEIKNMKFPQKMIANTLYKKLKNPLDKAADRYEKYLGDLTEKQIKKYLKDFTPPEEYFHSFNYVRTGIPIVLYPDDNYYQEFPKDSKDMLLHHNFDAYLYLLKNIQ